MLTHLSVYYPIKVALQGIPILAEAKRRFETTSKTCCKAPCKVTTLSLYKKCRKLWIWSHLLEKSLMENLIFYAVCNVVTALVLHYHNVSTTSLLNVATTLLTDAGESSISNKLTMLIQPTVRGCDNVVITCLCLLDKFG